MFFIGKEAKLLIFGKHVNRYYLRFAPMLLLGSLALLLVDYMQLVIPKLYRVVINGVKTGVVETADGVVHTFDIEYLLDEVCLPLLFVILGMVVGRFLWRVCFCR